VASTNTTSRWAIPSTRGQTSNREIYVASTLPMHAGRSSLLRIDRNRLSFGSHRDNEDLGGPIGDVEGLHVAVLGFH
jgi:hypothetical protein